MTLFAPDGSKWQKGMTIGPDDWAAIGFGIWRASIRTTIDETFAWATHEFQSRHLPFAGYIAMYPRTKVSPADQALTFHQACNGDTSIPAMLDWEGWPDGTASWTDVVETAGAIRSLGHVCGLVYTGYGFWTSQGKPTMSGHGMSLVNARYGNNSSGTITDVYEARGGDTRGSGWQTYGGLSTVIWQYGSKVTWGNRQMDMNAYKGRPADLAQWFWTPPPPKPQPPKPPQPIQKPDKPQVSIPPINIVSDEEEDMLYLVRSSRNGRAYITNWIESRMVSEPHEAESLRGHGVSVAADSGPHPLNDVDSGYIERIVVD